MRQYDSGVINMGTPEERLQPEGEQVPAQCHDIGVDEYRRRVEVLKEAMRRKRVDVALIQQSRDLYYYSGTSLYCFLVVPRDGELVLLVRINLPRAREESWIADIRGSSGLGDVKRVFGELDLGRAVVGIEEDITTVPFQRKLAGLLPGASFVDITPLILDQRMVKSPAEVACVRQAAYISNIGLRRAASVLRSGITEMELAAELELAKLMAGHDGAMMSRQNAAASGSNFVTSGGNAGIVSGYWIASTGTGPSAALPYGPSLRKVRAGDLVCIDHATMYRGYHSDEGRTFVVGKARDKQKRLFDVVRRAQDAAIAQMGPGVPVAEVYRAALRVAKDAGYEEYFMAYGQYGVEYLGHGLGLEIDEPPLVGPRTTTLLAEGMTLALEPKLIIPGWGGVDLEDTLVVTGDGCEVLTLGKRELVEVKRG